MRFSKYAISTLLVILLISNCVLTSHQREDVIVLVAESPADLVEYLYQVREGKCRFILTNNSKKIINILSKKDLSFKFLKKNSENGVMDRVSPHDLAYTLLYVSELRRGVQAEELLLLSERADEFETLFSMRKGEVSVVFFSSDGSYYAFLAAYAAVLKNASLLDMDSGFDPSYLKGVRDVIVVTSPLWRGNSYRYSKLMHYFTKLDEDPYLDVSFGILTGNYPETPFLTLLAGDIIKRIGFRGFVGISLVEDLPIARKVERVSSFLGLSPKVYSSDLNYSNLTEGIVKSILGVEESLIYLSLHGNPYVMALRSDGYPVLTALTVKELNLFGSLIITLSCSTLKFPDIDDPEDSIAYSFLDSGALAYVGSTRVEFSLESELGTSYPDLLLFLLMNGSSLGEAVKIVNNLKLRGSGGQDVESASGVLLGDPTLRIYAMMVPFWVSRHDEGYLVEVEETTPTLFLRFQEVGNPSIVSEAPKLHMEWYGDEKGTFVYITTLSTSYAGYFKAGDKIEVRVRKSENFKYILPYLLILSIVAISLIRLLRCR